MPSTAFGPLVEPGWPNLPQSDLGTKFVNAFAIGTEISRRKQALENQLAGMALKAQAMENQTQLREMQFGLAQQRLEFDRDKALQNAEFARERLGMADQTLGLRQAMFDAKQQKLSDAAEGTANLFNAEASLAEEGIHPGDKNFEAEYLRRISNTGAPPSVISAAARTALSNHYAQVRNRERDFDAQMKAFRERFGAEVFGNPMIQDVSVLGDPKSLPDDTTTTGVWPFRETKPTGKKLVSSVDPSGVALNKPVSLSVLEKYKKQYDQLIAGKNDIPLTHDHSDLGVYSQPANTMRERAQRIQSDPTASTAAKAAAEKWLRDNP